MSIETRIYQKENSARFFKHLKESVSDMYNSRFLARQLAKRDIKAQYRQSFIGIAWAFIIPLTTALVWIVINKSGAVKISDTGIPYPVYAFSGTLLWSIVSEAIKSPIASTNAARGIMSKINFPKEALILSGVYKQLFNTLVKVVVLLVFIFVYGVGFHSSMLLFPLTLIGALFFGTTIGLFLTPIGVLYKDITRMITMGLQFLMYATPVVFSIPEKEGFLKTVMEWNPITPLILTARDTVVGTTPEYLSYYFWILLICIPLFLVGLVLYRISIPILVERISA